MMIKSDDYKSIATESYGLYKEKGSKFEAYLAPVNSKKAFEEFLEKVKKLHFKARHHCYGYRIDYTSLQERANDDGEPSGTAGLPILGQLKSKELFDVACIVVRYFGGTKLGTSGLIRSYKNAAIDALENAEVITKTITEKIKISFEYSIMGELMQALKFLDLEIYDREMNIEAYFILNIPKSLVEESIIKIKAKLLKRVPEDVTLKTEVPNIKIEILD